MSITRTPSRSRLLTGLGVVSMLAAATIAAVLIVAGLGSGTEEPLFLRSASGTVSRIDPGTGTAQYEVDGAAVSADGSGLFRAVVRAAGIDDEAAGDDGSARSGGQTEVSRLDTDTGQPVTTETLDGTWEVRTVAPKGGAVALLPPKAEPEGGLYVPEPRSQTPIVVMHEDGTVQSFDLEGNFEPETFSLDEETLYLLEYFPPENPEEYYVRQLDLSGGDITDVYSPNVELEPEMRGKAQDQVISPDGKFLYTLYTLGDGEPVSDPTAPPDDRSRFSFIHVLSLDDDWSFCIFLPMPMGNHASPQLTMSIAPNGRDLYVADFTSGVTAEVDTETYKVVEHSPADRLQPGLAAPPSSAVAAGRFFTTHGDSGLVSIEPATGELTSVYWLDNGVITDLAGSADGRELRIALDDRIVIYDVVDNVETMTFDIPGAGGGTSFVGPPGQSVSQGSIECAC